MASTNGTAAPASSPPASPTPSSSPSEPPAEPSTDSPSSAAPSTSDPPPAPSSSPVSLPPSSSPEPEPSSSAPPPPPSSSAAPPPSSAPPSSTPPPPTSDRPTSTFTASSRPPTTQVVTSVVTKSARPGESSLPPETVVVTLISTPSADPQATNPTLSTAPSASSTGPAGLNDVNKGASSKDSGGLSSGGKIGIAVAVPIVVVALLAIAGILLWRRRKQRKHAEEARRKEVEEYGFNPNHDPSLPPVGMASEMAEDQSGYRGWGNTQTSSNRKASTTLTSGMTYSDSNSNPGGPHSPTQAYSDAHSNDPLVNGRRETLDSEGVAALGTGPNTNHNQAGVNRGPSNASSSYSAANHSEESGDYPIPMNNPQDYYENNNQYYQSPHYNDGYGPGPQPIIRDVSARRNTRIENPSVFPHQGNSGIAQNF